eukprot:6454853-Amphidinium_carterae.1
MGSPVIVRCVLVGEATWGGIPEGCRVGTSKKHRVDLQGCDCVYSRSTTRLKCYFGGSVV